MSWRFFRSIRLPLGLRMNVRETGVGWSWGLLFLRFGVSGTGQRWISIGIPGTALRFYNTLGRRSFSTEQPPTIQSQPGQIRQPDVLRATEPSAQDAPRRISWRNIRTR